MCKCYLKLYKRKWNRTEIFYLKDETDVTTYGEILYNVYLKQNIIGN